MPLPRNLTEYIDGSECMGTSLHTKINPSFDNLDTAAQQLSTNLATLSTTTFAISGSVINELINLQTNNTTNTSLITSVSSYIIPRAAKAWTKFDGTTITVAPCVAVFSSFNVLSVERFNTGAYKIEFDSWFVDNNYAITTSASTSGVYTYTLNATPSTVEVYSETVSAQPFAADAIISVIVNSF